MRLCIYLDLTDESDMEWIRAKVVPAVEDIVDEQGPEGEDRLDGEIEVSWDIEDD